MACVLLVLCVTRKHRLVEAPGPGLTVTFLNFLVLAQGGGGMLGAHQVFPIVPPRYALRCDFQAIVFLVPHVHTGNMGIYNIYIYIYI